MERKPPSTGSIVPIMQRMTSSHTHTHTRARARAQLHRRKPCGPFLRRYVQYRGERRIIYSKRQCNCNSCAVCFVGLLSDRLLLLSYNDSYRSEPRNVSHDDSSLTIAHACLVRQQEHDCVHNVLTFCKPANRDPGLRRVT